MVRIGIPRALLYYQYFPMWKTFFNEMGAEVVVSEPTTQAMVTSGSSRVVADTCLPVKIYLGHVISLVGKCDFVFVPAIRSVRRKTYNCAKFLGLPDMTIAVVPESPPILDMDIDINKGKRFLYQEIYRVGRRFSWNPGTVRRAALAAWQAFLDYHSLMSGEGLTPPKAIQKMLGTAENKETGTNQDQARATIAVIGHPYLLYDEHINHRLLHRLEQLHNRVLTPEMLASEKLDAGIVRLTGTAYWAYEEDVVGAGGHYLQSNVDGVIGIMAFGCGPDSQMMDIVRRNAAKQRVPPFMNLTVDEHTAETGIITRLEAFLDMIHRRKRREAEVCV